MHPALMQEMVATIAVERRREGEAARAAAGAARTPLIRLRRRRPAAPALPARGLDPAPRA